METINFDHKHARISQQELSKIGEQLKPEINKIKNALSMGYQSEYASIYLPTDKQYFDTIAKTIKQKKSLNPAMLIVIGIGGSNLGTMAIEQALGGILQNPEKSELKIYYADTVDTEYTKTLLDLMQDALDTKQTVLINVVSKSGTTVETIALFEIFLKLLIKYHPNDYHSYVVVTTDELSPLHLLAQKQKFDVLFVPKNVGGRYSVFSAVGLFPLGMMNIDLKLLLQGAYMATVIGCDDDIHNNVAAASAALIFLHYQQGLFIHDLFLFSKSLESVGKWYRQLVGESLGKMYDRDGNKVHVGITPTVSIGSIDLHSVGQLYLAGPFDKFTTFISPILKESENQKSNGIKIPNFAEYEKLVPHIQNKSLMDIMNAIFQGTQIAYARNHRPFMTMMLPEKNAFFIGQLLQLLMMQVMYTGYLLNVNPFDQPEVELYKKETRDILAHG